MFQHEKNVRAMQLAGLGLVVWLVFLLLGSLEDSGSLRWHPHMHWFDKLFWDGFMAVGPALVGLLVGVSIGGRRVFGTCRDCGGRFDVDKSQGGQWQCQSCCERYNRWNEWRQIQENTFSYRNEEERKWSRTLWESDPGYLWEDVFWQGPTGKGFPDEPVDSGDNRKE